MNIARRELEEKTKVASAFMGAQSYEFGQNEHTNKYYLIFENIESGVPLNMRLEFDVSRKVDEFLDEAIRLCKISNFKKGNKTGKRKAVASIRPARRNGLWLFIDPMGFHEADAYDLPIAIDISHIDVDVLRRTGGAAYAITAEEVEPIRDACNEYLSVVAEGREI